jgi:hypothetical protein
VWRDGLTQGLSAGAAVMPPISRYAEFPWAASVGNGNPLKLDTVFDDLFFMASSELNLLNTLLLADDLDGGRSVQSRPLRVRFQLLANLANTTGSGLNTHHTPDIV